MFHDFMCKKQTFNIEVFQQDSSCRKNIFIEIKGKLTTVKKT